MSSSGSGGYCHAVTRLNDHGQLIGDLLPAWTPRPLPTPALLDGRSCRLVPIADLDAAGRDALHAAVVAEAPTALWTYLAGGPFESREEFDRYLDGLLDRGHAMAVLTPQPAGILCLISTVADSGTTEIGAVTFGPSLQRTPAATEAVHLAAAHVFELGYRRLEWKCDTLNEPSRRAALRLGFLHEGMFRNAVVYKGRTRDTDWFSITDEEWPAVAEAHRRWLDPANFDHAGRQRSRLSELTAELRR
jgi:RimJ/RimL family protein N-acetyltransferase